jgi:hypothetical protein
VFIICSVKKSTEETRILEYPGTFAGGAETEALELGVKLFVDVFEGGATSERRSLSPFSSTEKHKFFLTTKTLAWFRSSAGKARILEVVMGMVAGGGCYSEQLLFRDWVEKVKCSLMSISNYTGNWAQHLNST